MTELAREEHRKKEENEAAEASAAAPPVAARTPAGRQSYASVAAGSSPTGRLSPSQAATGTSVRVLRGMGGVASPQMVAGGSGRPKGPKWNDIKRMKSDPGIKGSWSSYSVSKVKKELKKLNLG